MATNVFVSFDHDDQNQVSGFRLLKSNKNHPLDFRDHSLKEPVRDKSGKIIKHPPWDERSKPVRDEIIKKFENASKLVVLIGDDTHGSDWVEWEANAFYQMKKKLSGDKTWKRLRGMKLKQSADATIPDCLKGQSTKVMNWDPEALDKWLDENPDA